MRVLYNNPRNGKLQRLASGRRSMAYSKLIFRVHAIKRMFQRHISDPDVRYALKTGVAIEDYPNDKPYPSRLILGWCGARPLHVVAADNAKDGATIIISAYEPDADLWEPDFRRRKKL